MNTDREKLINWIRNTYVSNPPYIYKATVDDTADAVIADMLINNGVVIREKGEWLPCFIYTHHDVSNCLQGHDGWQCSICGESFDTQYDYCVCGADMRKKNQ